MNGRPYRPTGHTTLLRENCQGATSQIVVDNYNLSLGILSSFY